MLESAHSNGPLTGLKVLDLSQGIAGPFCAKLLGDLGADVVKAEPPKGDRSRAEGPFPAGAEMDPEQSAGFFFLNTSKRGIVLDIDDPGSQPTLARLVRSYDVVIVDGSA